MNATAQAAADCEQSYAAPAIDIRCVVIWSGRARIDHHGAFTRACVGRTSEGFQPLYEQTIDGNVVQTRVGIAHTTMEVAQAKASERAALIQHGFSVHRYGDVFGQDDDNEPLDLDLAEMWTVAVVSDSFYASLIDDVPLSDSEERAWDVAYEFSQAAMPLLIA
ncbi:hypothetical protein GIY62_35485 (plasmid) [Burkholderia plantarii]|uniref:hypothetical protein n=1 Tax=Burkholderia plantarii TaxID=41899 RepID=UPI00272965A4|nr:hypothetical protein [Burkholderia plantarii]WLE64163.1 hypothetical protein GIY62_35485 [Burkholderia plantarii]